jgi:steroid delta-isomerase-like uncharacterized protein
MQIRSERPIDSSDGTMTREQIVTVLNALQRGFNSRDSQGLAAIHADDGIVHSPIFGEIQGRTNIEKSYRDLFLAWGDARFEQQDLIVDGNRAAQVFTMSATHTSELFGVAATNRRFKIQGVLVFEFRDGKIAVERRLYDFTSLLIQMGVIKAKPAH